MAAASITLWLPALLVLWAGAASAAYIGGATSATGLMATIERAYSKRAVIGPYSAAGSAAGINGFAAGKLLAGVSDAPMSLVSERRAGPKFTLANAISSYSFIVSGSGSVRLSAAQVYAIYAGRITQWAQIRGSGLRGAIVPVARSIGSGSTAVVTRWLQQSRAPIPAVQVGLGIWRAGSRHTVYLATSQEVARYVRGNRLAIGYVQTGAGLAAGNSEVAVLNPGNGRYMKAAGALLLRAIPAQLPPARASWAGVPASLLNKAASYPIVSFIHIFVRQHNGRAVGIIKPFLKFLMTQEAQGLAHSAGFTAIPGWIKGDNLLAIGLIKP